MHCLLNLSRMFGLSWISLIFLVILRRKADALMSPTIYNNCKYTSINIHGFPSKHKSYTPITSIMCSTSTNNAPIYGSFKSMNTGLYSSRFNNNNINADQGAMQSFLPNTQHPPVDDMGPHDPHDGQSNASKPAERLKAVLLRLKSLLNESLKRVGRDPKNMLLNAAYIGTIGEPKQTASQRRERALSATSNFTIEQREAHMIMSCQRGPE